MLPAVEAESEPLDCQGVSSHSFLITRWGAESEVLFNKFVDTWEVNKCSENFEAKTLNMK